MSCTLTGMSPREMRECLEMMVMKRLNLRPEGETAIRPPHWLTFVQAETQTLLRFLSVAQLVQCLADHGAQLFEFINAEVNLHQQGAGLVVDHKGANWLVFDDSCVEFPAHEFCHDLTPIAAADPATVNTLAQGQPA